jgi:hypothetical protein
MIISKVNVPKKLGCYSRHVLKWKTQQKSTWLHTSMNCLNFVMMIPKKNLNIAFFNTNEHDKKKVEQQTM